MHNVNYTKQAKKDIHEIFNYIASDNKLYAEKVSQSILGFINGVLAAFPKLGTLVQDNLFEIVEPTFKYKIVYRFYENYILIVGIFKWQDR